MALRDTKSNTYSPNSSRILISDRRNRLSDDAIEAVECLKSWGKASLLDTGELDCVGAMLEGLQK